jgi:hypothetical protein
VIFILARPSADPALAPSVSDRGAHEEIELISTHHFDKFSVWSQNLVGILNHAYFSWTTTQPCRPIELVLDLVFMWPHFEIVR